MSDKDKLSFNIDCELDTTHLHCVIEECVEANYPDSAVIVRLQQEYKESCWFSVIAFAEQVIYG